MISLLFCKHSTGANHIKDADLFIQRLEPNFNVYNVFFEGPELEDIIVVASCAETLIVDVLSDIVSNETILIGIAREEDENDDTPHT